MKYQDGTARAPYEKWMMPLSACILFLISCLLAAPSFIMMIISVFFESVKSVFMYFPFMILSQILFLIFLTLTFWYHIGSFTNYFISFSSFYLNFGFLLTIGNIMVYISDNDPVPILFAVFLYLLQLCVVVYYGRDESLQHTIFDGTT